MDYEDRRVLHPAGWPAWVGICAAYLLAAAVGKLVTAAPSGAMLIWPAAAVGVVALVRLGARATLGVALGGFVYTLWRLGAAHGEWTGAHVLAAFANAGIVAGRAWVGWWLYRKVWTRLGWTGLTQRLLVLTIMSGPVACAPAALLGALSLVAAGHVPMSAWWHVVGVWYVSDALGVLVATPALLGVTSRTRTAQAVAVGGLALGLAGWFALSSMEVRAMRAELARDATRVQQLIALSERGHDDAGEARARLEGAVKEVDLEGLHLRITVGGEPPLLRPALGRTSVQEMSRILDASDLVDRSDVGLWHLEVGASPAYIARHRTLLPLATLMCLWLLAALGAGYLRLLHRRGDELEALVRLRTHDLAAAKERAEAANRAKSMFLAHMSHELRTPMNGVIGMVALIEQDELPDEQRKRVKMLDASARSLLGVIDNVLDIAKIEQGKVELCEEPVNLAAVVQQVVGTVCGAAAGAGTQLHVDLQPQIPKFIWGDEKRVVQVLLNLVGNALKFAAGGNIWIRGHIVTKDRLRIEVQDDGIGIPADRQASIFESFVQSDASTTRRFGGTGLGLAITRELVEQMGGALAVRSEPGQGATFSLELPVRVAVTADVVVKDRALTVRRGLRVLLAEDNRTNQYVAKGLLEREGCRVEVAEDGVRALERWRAADFDLIFMDCQMPNLDGFEASRQIRSIEAEGQGRHTPIVALTAGALDTERARCFAAGMNDFLSKPVELSELRAMLSKWGAVQDQGLA